MTKPGIIDSIIDLGAATTILAIDQVENAFTAFSRPGLAIDHVRDTMQNLSTAMNTSSAHSSPAHSRAEHSSAGYGNAGHKEAGKASHQTRTPR